MRNQSNGDMGLYAGTKSFQSVPGATHQWKRGPQRTTQHQKGLCDSEYGWVLATFQTRTRTPLGVGIRIVATPELRMKSQLLNLVVAVSIIAHTTCATDGVDILTDGMWGGRRKCPMTGCNNYIARQRRRPHRMCGRCTRLARGED
jgi:hypothetical protein